MHKIIVLSIISLLPFNSFSSDADGMSASCIAGKPAKRTTTKQCPPLYYDPESGGGLVFTGLKKNKPGEVMPPPAEDQRAPRAPTLGPQATAQHAKRSRLERPLTIDKIVPYILSKPTENLFADAFVTKTDEVHCPQLGVLLTHKGLFDIITGIKEVTDPQFFLPPPNAAGTTPHRANIVPASLESAETLYNKLLRLVPEADEFKHLTGASIQEDGDILIPLLNKVITMDRLLKILTTSEDGEFVMSTLSEDLKNIVREAYQLKVGIPKPVAPI